MDDHVRMEIKDLQPAKPGADVEPGSTTDAPRETTSTPVANAGSDVQGAALVLDQAANGPLSTHSHGHLPADEERDESCLDVLSESQVELLEEVFDVANMDVGLIESVDVASVLTGLVAKHDAATSAEVVEAAEFRAPGVPCFGNSFVQIEAAYAFFADTELPWMQQALEGVRFLAPVAALDLATISTDAGREGACATESAGVVGESSADTQDMEDGDLYDRSGDSRDQHNEKSRIRRHRIHNACVAMRRIVPGASAATDQATLIEHTVEYLKRLQRAVTAKHGPGKAKRIAREFVKKFDPYCSTLKIPV